MCVICVLQVHVAYGVFSIQELANTQQVLKYVWKIGYMWWQ